MLDTYLNTFRKPFGVEHTLAVAAINTARAVSWGTAAIYTINKTPYAGMLGVGLDEIRKLHPDVYVVLNAVHAGTIALEVVMIGLSVFKWATTPTIPQRLSSRGDVLPNNVAQMKGIETLVFRTAPGVPLTRCSGLISHDQLRALAAIETDISSEIYNYNIVSKLDTEAGDRLELGVTLARNRLTVVYNNEAGEKRRVVFTLNIESKIPWPSPHSL